MKSGTKRIKMLAFAKYGSRAASTRQRLLQYLPHLEAAGIDVEYQPLLGDDYVEALATGGGYSKMRVARNYLRRMKSLLTRREADLVWVYAELFPYLPGWFERLAFTSGRPVIYDCDDAFFFPYESSPRPIVRRLLGGKLEPLLSGAEACCCGNSYLRDYAGQFCEHTIILPTVVDTDIYRPVERDRSGPLVIGWIGSPSTWPMIRTLLPLLQQLVASHGVRIHVVGAGSSAEADHFEGLELIEWSEDTEVQEVQKMHIGIMPLPNEPWTRGKSGYKLIQYMACGLPVVASPVGVNAEIVLQGKNGFLAESQEEWLAALTRLVEDAELRRSMGHVGRERSEECYSLKSHGPRLTNLIRSISSAAQEGARSD
jgi:glycosyltransferase involved in cell wall biosynthesis